MASLATRITLASSLPAFLLGPSAVLAKEQTLPTAEEIGQALLSAEYDRCRSGHENNPIARSHCGLDGHFAVSVTFEQILCVNHGADSERNPIARCVFKGEKRTRPNLAIDSIEMQSDGNIKAKSQKVSPPEFYGDGEGAIDLFYINGRWLSIPEPKISFE